MNQDQTYQAELWDVLDENRIPTGRLHRRGEKLPAGDYHLTVHIWTRRADGMFLLTKRSPNKTFPLMWETTAGSAIAGDDSLSAALREVREETGLILKPENGRLMMTQKSRGVFADIWYFQQDFTLDDVVLQEGETCDRMLATKEEILQMDKDEALVPFSYLHDLMDTID